MINVCKYNKDAQNIIISGQFNFYRPFIGIIDIATGDPIKIINLFSKLNDDKVGLMSNILEMDSDLNFYVGLYFLGKQL